MEISSIYRADRLDVIHLILYIYQKKEAEKYSEILWLLTKREQWKKQSVFIFNNKPLSQTFDLF